MKKYKKRLPPLNTLLAFDESAKKLSFSEAAKELNLTQSAISRQIKKLEDNLGFSLFKRNNKSVELTTSGKIFHSSISQIIESIRKAINEVEKNEKNNVTIMASLAMSSFWLMPAILKIKPFSQEINVSLLADDNNQDKINENIDLAILYGDGKWKKLNSHKLFIEKVFPVCSPKYKSENNKIETIKDLANCTLIDVIKTTSICGNWENWFRYTGNLEIWDQVESVVQVSNFDLAYQAAEAGQGVALSWNYGINHILKSQRLIRPIDEYVSTGMAEYLVTNIRKENRKDIEKIKNLLIEYSENEGAAIF